MRVKKKHKVLKRILCIFLGILVFIGGVMAFNAYDNQSFKVTFYHMDSEKRVKSLRVILLTDLHEHEYGEGNSDLIHRIDVLKPDIIAMVGDMVMYPNGNTQIVLDLIKNLSENYPVYFAYGNHEIDYIMDANGEVWPPKIYTELTEAGAKVLNESEDKIKINGDNIVIIGDTQMGDMDWEDYHSKYLKEMSDKKEFTIFINHFPEIFESKMDDFHFDLSLCGHAHGGLARISPFSDGVYSPNQGIFPEFTSGIRKGSYGTLVISRGLGNSHGYEKFLRINNKPELVVIDIN